LKNTTPKNAPQRAALDDQPWALIDYAVDYRAATRIGVTSCLQSPHAANPAIGWLQALGKSVSLLSDHPGLLVMRTVCMLVNEGIEAVHMGVADAAGVDTAMRGGVGYPQGPLAMGDALGPARVLTVLDNLQQVLGEDRYRPSLGLRQAVWTNRNLRDMSTSEAAPV